VVWDGVSDSSIIPHPLSFDREALERLAGADETSARVAFESLCPRARRFLHASLRDKGADPDTREDVIQETLSRVWRARSRYRNEGPGAWYALLRLTAHRCYLDHLSARGATVELSLEEPPPEELRVVDEMMEQVSTAVRSGELQDAADELWLGTRAGPDGSRRLLAAQLYYLDGEPWDRILRLLGHGVHGEPPVTRKLLDDWLTDPATLRALAFRTLHYSNERLSAELLSLAEEDARLAELMRRAAAEAPEEDSGLGWTWGEVRVILWRYRYALLVEQILARGDCAHDAEKLEELLVRTRALLPFSREMDGLLAQLERVPGMDARRTLAAPGLWQRLAFQYRYADELPHRDVGERIEPAAERAGYRVTAAMLNVWLAGRRLLGRFIEHCAKKGLSDVEP